jgi:L-ornithine Nalpha-acyltransferase
MDTLPMKSASKAELVPPPCPLVESGNLVARLALSAAEIDAAQHLRYRVFYEEMRARPTAEAAVSHRDRDEFDPYCDHLLVIDRTRTDLPCGVVGTYRLMRRSAAARHGRFYSSDEYDITPLVNLPGEIMELGRSCVDAEYRNRPTMQLLWNAIAAYVWHYDVPVMFGCASLPGADPRALALPLAYLRRYHLAPEPLRPVAVPDRYVDMDLVPADRIDVRLAQAALPPLIKGYLRLGGFVGDGAVVDHQFNTTDVCIVVKTDLVTEKYVRHYERSARRGGPG